MAAYIDNNKDLEHQEQNTGNAIHTENVDLEHQEQNAEKLIHPERMKILSLKSKPREM